ncbi:xylulose kinase isoform X2 [Hydra vulgaris]|uniref:Xylulose kinase n=1 Tax=Hydra vulgaris TaxID=6087 RepID=A0ABM4BI41_HYDVU
MKGWILFDSELKEFNTQNGVHRHNDGETVTSPVLVWVKALDIILMKLAESELSLKEIEMITGSAQQHGSVFWKKSSEITLANLNVHETLVDQLQECFEPLEVPVWMDCSTAKQCSQLEDAVGGSIQLAKLTGSRAFKRFTGNQIAKIYQTNEDIYLNCERICLVSNFLASLFLGHYAPIDYSDGSGMNLLNIASKKWDDCLLNACAPGLAMRLGEPVSSSTIIGNISMYLVKRFGFSPTCRLVAFTGDNPSSLAGLNLTSGDIACSLGTSDTLLLWTHKAEPNIEGSVFVNPLQDEEFMTMLCFKNGSLSRQIVCDQHCGGSWSTFNEMLKKTKPGNNHKIGLYFHELEILPEALGVYRWNDIDELVNFFTSEEEVRAVLEGQFLIRRYYAEKYGFAIGPTTRIIATGGASNNTSILQVLSDVFGVPVYRIKEESNSACLGCIYRCARVKKVHVISNHVLVCSPTVADETYQIVLSRYSRLLKTVLKYSEKSNNGSK